MTRTPQQLFQDIFLLERESNEIKLTGDTQTHAERELLHAELKKTTHELICRAEEIKDIQAPKIMNNCKPSHEQLVISKRILAAIQNARLNGDGFQPSLEGIDIETERTTLSEIITVSTHGIGEVVRIPLDIIIPAAKSDWFKIGHSSIDFNSKTQHCYFIISFSRDIKA